MLKTDLTQATGALGGIAEKIGLDRRPGLMLGAMLFGVRTIEFGI